MNVSTRTVLKLTGPHPRPIHQELLTPIRQKTGPKRTIREKIQKKKRVPMSAPFSDSRSPAKPRFARTWRPGR
jgi:hypothetical protein